MPLTPREEAMHLEIKVLQTFKAKSPEEEYIYKQALQSFIEQNQVTILSILDQHFTKKMKG